MGPYRVELHSNGFHLYRREPGDDDPGVAEHTDRLFIAIAEVPALLAALAQVVQHPHYTDGLWDVSRSWLSTSSGYAPEQIAGADEPWDVSRTRAAVVIAGPLWNPLIYPSGAFAVEVEYARLGELVDALEELGSL